MLWRKGMQLSVEKNIGKVKLWKGKHIITAQNLSESYNECTLFNIVLENEVFFGFAPSL